MVATNMPEVSSTNNGVTIKKFTPSSLDLYNFTSTAEEVLVYRVDGNTLSRMSGKNYLEKTTYELSPKHTYYIYYGSYNNDYIINAPSAVGTEFSDTPDTPKASTYRKFIPEVDGLYQMNNDSLLQVFSYNEANDSYTNIKNINNQYFLSAKHVYLFYFEGSEYTIVKPLKISEEFKGDKVTLSGDKYVSYNPEKSGYYSINTTASTMYCYYYDENSMSLKTIAPTYLNNMKYYYLDTQNIYYFATNSNYTCVINKPTLVNLQFFDVKNDEIYPWTLNDNTYISTNKIDSSKSTLTINVLLPVTLEITLKVSSEGGYDKLIMYYNGSKYDEISGDETVVKNITLYKDDVLSFVYSKDSSNSIGNDCGYVKIK